MNSGPYYNPNATFMNGLLNYGYLLWVLVVRGLRETGGAGVLGFLRGVLMALVFCIAFYIIMSFFGLAGLTVRGDMMVFILIGVGFFFAMKFTMVAAMSAMRKSGPLTQHPHVSPLLFVYADSLGIFYNWFLAIVVIFLGNSLYTGKMELAEPIMFFPIFFLCWLTGVGLGMVIGYLLAVFSWAMILKRVMFKVIFFTSGKFTNANVLPRDMLEIMSWNPLFHLIDQMREAAFVNYTAHHTNMVYPTIFCFALLLLGHLLYSHLQTRRNVMTG